MFLVPKGNLVCNGDFELGSPGEPPKAWCCQNVVIVGEPFAFTGVQAASMGSEVPGDPAFMYQDVDVIAGQRYLLTFQMGTTAAVGGDLMVTVTWLSPDGFQIGTGLSVFISGVSSPVPSSGFWKVHSYLTDLAPLGACGMRLAFTMSPSASGSNAVMIDGVTLTQI